MVFAFGKKKNAHGEPWAREADPDGRAVITAW
jgi:hypothetical protein